LSKWTKRAAEHAESGGQTAQGISDEALRAVYAAASWLIDYPGDELLERLPAISGGLDRAGVPAHLPHALDKTIGHLGAVDPIGMRADYVETLDTRRRGCLLLPYFSTGGPRKRRQALRQHSEIYRSAGPAIGE